MRKIALILSAAVVLLFAVLDWKAEATALKASGLPEVTKNFSPVTPVDCGGPGPNCPWGRIWVCGVQDCWCAPCGGYYRPYWRRRWR
jgi:hypothetical protein